MHTHSAVKPLAMKRKKTNKFGDPCDTSRIRLSQTNIEFALNHC